MTRYITGANLQGYHPGSSTSDYTIPGDDVFSFDVEQKVGRIKDTAKLAIDNQDDQYTGQIDHGHKFEIVVETADVTDPTLYGSGTYGGGTYGGTSTQSLWTGMVRDYSINYHGAGEATFEIDAEDFVFAVLGMRKVYNEWRDRQIVGSNGIINEILADRCPEIDPSELPSRPETTSITSFGADAIDVVGELALRIPAIPYSIGEQLRLDHPDMLIPRFELGAEDFGTMKFGSQDSNMATMVRVRGGTDSRVDDEQLAQDGTTTVTDSSFETQRIDTRKSFISEINLYTVADREGEDIIVRIQKDVGDGSGPIAPDDETSDIASKRLSSEYLDDDGFTLFIMPSDTENVLPEPRPWIIVQTDGSTGQDIGINTSSGELTYEAYYPYPIIVERENSTASAEYRRRDGGVNQPSISTFEEANDRSEAFLSENAIPRETFKFDAESTMMHEHPVGGVVRIEETAATGPFVAMEKKDHYEGNQLNTDFSFQSLESIS